MSETAIPASRLVPLRSRIVGRILATAVPSTVIVAYLLGLIMELSGMALLKALLFILAPLLVAIVGVVYGVITLLLKQALSSTSGDGEGARLRRILELPRRIEMIPYATGWVIGAAAFALIAAFVFGKSPGIAWVGGIAGLFAALFLGPMLTMMVEDDLRQIAVEEFHRSPKVKLPSSGFFWVRQRWYLPYAFSIAIVSMVVFSGIVIVKKYDEAVANLLRSIDARGLGGAREAVRAELERLVVSAGVPVATIVGILLGAFGIIGWMLARRQARAAAAVEESLRAMAAGSSRLPGWISTDEMGDLALATAGVASEMQHVFEQLRAMAAGDLTRELQGDSGLIGAFRESQSAMLQLARRMIALSKGDLAEQAVIPGDLGRHFDELQCAFRATVDQAQTIAQGDLRADVEIPGALGNAIQRMTTNLRTMVGQTQAVSGNVGDIVVSLQSAASQLSAATTEQVAAVTETANTMTEMAQTSAVSADRASELIKQGESASQVVEEGGEAAESTAQAMAAISAALGKVSAASASLAERVKRIDSITETVSFLADQSSTLAINAAIEAARAGESGKGFAVVAREIRTLAGDSRKATTQIKELLAEIRDRTQQVDDHVATGASTVEDGNRLVQRLGEVISQLGVTLHDAVGLMRQVEGSARQHQAGVGQVSQALTNMQKASESIRDGARLLGELSSKAHEMSESLKGAAGAYSLPADAA